MKFFFDIQYLQKNKRGLMYSSVLSQLISVAILAENGHGIYLISTQFNPKWLSENDKPKALLLSTEYEENYLPIYGIKKSISRFIEYHSKKEDKIFYGYNCGIKSMLLNNIYEHENCFDLAEIEKSYVNNLTLDDFQADPINYSEVNMNTELPYKFKNELFKEHLLYPVNKNEHLAINGAKFASDMYDFLSQLGIIK